tara:strand:+ start:137 stop:262 length:126 start_codon:yes stop_codon:yes gene_type:complete
MGKGMQPKKGYNQKLYAENYDSIFRKNKKDENNKTINKESK